MEIKKKLKDARANAGLTQEQVAEKIMVSRQTISNWENGKSLPDIISIINLSDLYQISLDELLKGDTKMKEKIEKDVKVAEGNKRLILRTAFLLFAVSIIYSISTLVGGAFNDFCEAAIRWVVLGIGVAFAMTYMSQKESKKIKKYTVKMAEKRKSGKFPSERGRNYTPLREVVHCALPGGVLRTADDFRRFPICSNRLILTNFYAFICFANFPLFVFWSHIPRTMYFTGFAVIFDCSKPAAFQPYPPNFILGENSFCFLKFPISHFSNLGDNHFPFGGYWGIKFCPQYF